MRKIFIIFFIYVIYGQWSYDWSVRTDHHGKPAGIFTTSPFPITEDSTTYHVKTDEYPSGLELNLGTKYYVDGHNGSDSNGGTSLSDEWETIAHAISAVSSGNKTIIIRGAHDGFDGIYLEHGLSLNGKSGTDQTHRYTIVGYNQERPIIDAEETNETDIFSRADDDSAYITLQRMTLRNSARYGIILNSYTVGYERDRFFWCFDLNMKDCFNSTIYYLNADLGWIYHCTVDSTWGHAYKIGDGASFCKIEWCVVNGAGYYPGLSVDSLEATHSACGIDLPSDNDDPRNAQYDTVRYNIVKYAYAYGMQFRYNRLFNVHHNEIDSCGWFGWRSPPGGVLSTVHNYNIIFYAGWTEGEFYSNLIHDGACTGDGSGSGSPDGTGLYISSCDNLTPTINIYNNLFYGYTGNCIRINSSNTGATIRLLNNSFYKDTPVGYTQDECLIDLMGSETTSENNIFYQNGTGACVDYQSDTNNDYNLYYHPNGSEGDYVDGAHDVTPESQDFWLAIMSGAFSTNEGALDSLGSATDAGTSQSGYFTDDYDSNTRSAPWDLGAREYSGGVGGEAAPVGSVGNSYDNEIDKISN